MKKTTLLTIIALLCAASFLKAQHETAFKFGLHITPSIKWLNTTTNGLANDGTKVGFSYGLVAEYFFGERYSFCSGVDFSYRGGSLKVPDSAGNPVSKDFRLQYLEVPITLKMFTKAIGAMTYYAKFGVSPGINIKATSKSPSTGNDESIKNDISTFYTALKIGLGAEYEISDQTMLFAGLTWNNGFTDVFNSSTAKATNNAVELELGVLF